MAAVRSTMVELESVASEFRLPNVSVAGEHCRLSDFSHRPVLLMFICNHCPYVIHLMPELSLLANDAVEQGFGVAAISSNDAELYPQDGPEKMRSFASNNSFNFPYLYDESQDVAKQYRAACTPDFYVYNSKHALVYRGQMDGSRPGNNIPVTGVDLRLGLDAALGRMKVPNEQNPSMGCNIKWISGNEPGYF